MKIHGRNFRIGGIVIPDPDPEPTGIRAKANFTGYWYDTLKHSTDGIGTGNVGSYFELNISNTTKLDLLVDSWNGNPGFLAYLSVSVNGANYSRTATHPNFDGIGTYPILSGLNASLTYNVRIMVSNLFTSASQLWAGSEVFILNDIVGSVGAVFTRPNDTREVLLVQGDSISAAYNNAGSDQTKGEWGFVHLLEDLTGMRVVPHGFGSSGLIAPGEGGVPRFGLNIFNLNASTPLIGELIPKKILIEGGTNDASADNTEFVTRYKELVAGVKARWTGIEIYILPPLNNTKRAQVLSIIADDSSLNYISPDAWVHTVTYADSLHPDQNGHQVMASNIAPNLI